MKTAGIVVLFGSGETLDTGRKIQRNVLMALPREQRVVILETPAGFQPNSEIVARELAEVFQTSLKEFVKNVSVVPARKKETAYSPDDEKILSPLQDASYIVLGPGSPSYAANQLRDTKARSMILEKWQDGATLVLSSAAAIASGEYVLPVYEIYKAGHDLSWEKGIDLFTSVGLPFSVLTHWNNTDGGEKLDTSHCFMGKDRFVSLYALFPLEKPLVCIDEHTAAICNFAKGYISIEGKGSVTLFLQGKQMLFERDHTYDLTAFLQGEKKLMTKDTVIIKKSEEKKYLDAIPEKITALLEKRKTAKEQKDFSLADSIRKEIESLGYIVDDIQGEQKVSIKK